MSWRVVGVCEKCGSDVIENRQPLANGGNVNQQIRQHAQRCTSPECRWTGIATYGDR